MDLILLRCGMAIFALLGLLHLIYTVMDLITPKKFAPRDHTLLALMKQTRVRIGKNPRNFWLSYMGFNVSHSVGVLIFALVFSTLTIIEPSIVFHPAMSAIMIGTGIAYVVTAHYFWFSVPFIGSTAATFLIIAGVVVHFAA